MEKRFQSRKLLLRVDSYPLQNAALIYQLPGRLPSMLAQGSAHQLEQWPLLKLLCAASSQGLTCWGSSQQQARALSYSAETTKQFWQLNQTSGQWSEKSVTRGLATDPRFLSGTDFSLDPFEWKSCFPNSRTLIFMLPSYWLMRLMPNTTLRTSLESKRGKFCRSS